MRQKNKRRITAAIIAGCALLLCAGAVVKLRREKVNIEYLKKENNMGTEIYTTSFSEVKDIYKASTSSKIAKELEYLANKKATVDNPVWAYNPFGTNQCSFYVGFKTKEESYLKYTISVNDPAIEDFTEVAYIQGGQELTKEHAYSLTGFVPGYENTVTLQVYNKEDSLIGEASKTFDVPEVFDQEEVLIEYKDGESSQQLSNGLYAVFCWGNENELSKTTLLYDNNGVMRGKIPQIKRYGARIEQIGEDILYIIDKDKLALVSPIGQVVRVYKFPEYSYHHDFIYDEASNKIFVLVNDEAENATTLEDIVISIDVESGDVQRFIDFKDIFPDLYEAAIKAVEFGGKSEDEGKDTDKIDWIHVNSIDMVDEDSMVFSGRELSLIFKLNNIWTNPTADYIIADEMFVEGTSEEGLLLAQAGDQAFAPQYGQHNVIVEKDNSLQDGSYYLTLYNNNRGVSNTRPELDYSGLKNVGIDKVTEREGIDSYYYKYLVNENNRTYQLVDSIAVPYAGIVSNVQRYENNFVICSGSCNVIGEYDADGVLIRQLQLENDPKTYRTEKHTFEGVWFQNK